VGRGGDLEGPEQVQREQQHHPRQRRHEEWLLELEPPAHRVARRAEPEHGRGENEQRSEDAGGVGQGMRPHRPVVGVHRPGEAVGLQRQDRKDAGHRVEQYAPEERQKQHPGEARPARR
jgi:hypothetical protein